LAALEASGLADTTLVVFTSDNGPENTAYERAEKFGHFSMGELRGVKRDAWEGGHRVPFVARWPGHIPPGATSDEPICQVDMMATFATVVGATLPADAAEDSFDILPALLGQPVDKPLRPSMIHHSSGGQFAIRQGDWVFIDAPSGEDSVVETDWMKRERGYERDDQPGQLFNLRDDLAQRHNRFAEQSERVAEMRAQLERQQAAERTR
jgi:arylsulfatase A